MEYHNDRFQDFSLMIFKGNVLVGILPAHVSDNQVFSHKGLSYGGLVVSRKLKVEDYYQVFKVLLKYLKNKNVTDLFIKELPYIYNKNLSGEQDYFLNRAKAHCISVDSYYVIDNSISYKPNRNRRRAIVKAQQMGAQIVKQGVEMFWKDILIPNLFERFGVKPVHTVKEIILLSEKFPENIKHFFVEMDSEIKAGVIIFETPEVAHFQYSSGALDRNETGALDYLFDYVIRKYSSKKYISFGSSSTDGTLKIDQGLSYWKESFGACLMSQKQYVINVDEALDFETFFK